MRIGLLFCTSVSALLALAVAVPDARAQQAVLAGAVDVAAGVEGGGSGHAAGVRRSRTTVRVGVEGWVDESPANMLGLAAIVELEPKASIGVDLRYIRLVADVVALHAGAIGIIAPKHMIGATFGAAYRLEMSESVDLNLGTTANVYLLGADLPEDQVLWQGMLQGGVRIAF